tara:strand:+ start:214 stop:372 length:159 start_codon:yes stop_codon:yes gene_type:complete
MKLIVCESCEAEFKIQHNMDDRLYTIVYCPFCAENLPQDEDESLDLFEDYDE